MVYAIPSNLYHCSIGSSFIVLDLSMDRYFLLSEKAADRFSAFLDESADASDLVWLENEGLVGRNCNATHPFLPAQISPPKAGISNERSEHGSFLWVVRAILAQWNARRQIGRRSLAKLFAGLRCEVTLGVNDEGNVTQRVAKAFQRARRYYPASDQCLSRSIAMKRMLASEDCNARLIIGVTLPFAAHCWVQQGSTILTDPVDLVLPYTPILAL